MEEIPEQDRFKAQTPQVASKKKQQAAVAAAPSTTSTNQTTEGDTPAESISTREEMIDPMTTPLWEIDQRILNPFAELPPKRVWAKIGNRPTLVNPGFTTFSAKPKQGKSLGIYAMALALLTQRPMGALTPLEQPRLIIVFDTEMDKPTLMTRQRTMQKDLGDNGKRFVVAPLVEVEKSKRTEVIEELTAKFHPDIVVIDQVARLLNDFNDPKEAVAFGEWLNRYSQAQTTLVVIHQNKASDNTQMKGHLGSILNELAMENYSVRRDNGVFSVNIENSRFTNTDDAESFMFALNSDGAIIAPDDILTRRQEEEAVKWRDNFARIFGNDEELTRTELERRLTKQDNIEQRAASNKISLADKFGIFNKVKRGRNVHYSLTRANPNIGI